MKLARIALAIALAAPSAVFAQTAPAPEPKMDCCETMKAEGKTCCCEDMDKKDQTGKSGAEGATHHHH